MLNLDGSTLCLKMMSSSSSSRCPKNWGFWLKKCFFYIFLRFFEIFEIFEVDVYKIFSGLFVLS